jgi:hypothetical protein
MVTMMRLEKDRLLHSIKKNALNIKNAMLKHLARKIVKNPNLNNRISLPFERK